MTDRQRTWIDDQMDHERELAQRRQQWDQQKKAEAEQRERQQKQAALEAHLHSRSQEYLDHTGSAPTTAVLESWQTDFVNN